MGFLLHFCQDKECTVDIQGIKLKIEEISTRQLYLHHVNNVSKRPTDVAEWNPKLDFIIDEPMWKIIYVKYQKLLKDTNIMNFQFKITHRILACNYNLEIWKISQNNRCHICNEIDAMEHIC